MPWWLIERVQFGLRVVNQKSFLLRLHKANRALRTLVEQASMRKRQYRKLSQSIPGGGIRDDRSCVGRDRGLPASFAPRQKVLGAPKSCTLSRLRPSKGAKRIPALG